MEGLPPCRFSTMATSSPWGWIAHGQAHHEPVHLAVRQKLGARAVGFWVAMTVKEGFGEGGSPDPPVTCPFLHGLRRAD